MLGIGTGGILIGDIDTTDDLGSSRYEGVPSRNVACGK